MNINLYLLIKQTYFVGFVGINNTVTYCNGVRM